MERSSVSENDESKDILISENLKKNLDAINVFIQIVSENYELSFQDVLDLLRTKEGKKDILIPTSILRDRTLGILEAVTKYLKEDLNLTYHKIAVLLNRDDRVVWVTYNNAFKKKNERLAVGEPNYWLPVLIFADPSLGPLESISKYLIEDIKLDFSTIAKLLNRDNRSIWSCYKRAKNKLNKNGIKA